VAVTLITLVIAAPVLFAEVKLGTLPDPLAAERPVVVLLFVQLNDPPAGALVNVVAGIVVPGQTVELNGTEATGEGFTVTVVVKVFPVQVPDTGVTVYVAVATPVVELVSAWLMLP
jgi:hypothetical protein